MVSEPDLADVMTVSQTQNQPGRHTLDMEYRFQIRKAGEAATRAESLRARAEKVRKRMDALRRDRSLRDLTETQSRKYFEMRDQLESLETEMAAISSGVDDGYVGRVAHVMHSYYRVDDDGRRATRDEPTDDVIKTYFNRSSQNGSSPAVGGDILSEYETRATAGRVKDLPATQTQSAGPCPACNVDARALNMHEGLMVCRSCGSVEKVVVDCEGGSYKDPPREISYFAYKRLNHFNEWLAQSQGCENTAIPDDVMDTVRNELLKRKDLDLSKVTKAAVKDILKKHRLNRYYEHTPYIVNRLQGVPRIPPFPPHLEDVLRDMFKQIQTPFIRNAPQSRKNFLSYAYVLRKMVQLTGFDSYLSYFPLLKSREKLHVQDQIWKRICEELRWEFIPSQ